MDELKLTALDAWSDYCSKSDELALLILSLQDGPYTVAMAVRVSRMRNELESILDTMIGGLCPQATESKNIGSPESVKGA